MFRLNDYPLWIFLVAISINVFFAQQKNIAFKTYLNLVIPMFFIYLLSEIFASSKNFDVLAKTICFSSILVSSGGILEFLFGFNPLYEHYIQNPYYTRFIFGLVQPMSTQFNPTPLAGFLLGCFPFCYLLYKRDGSFFRLLGATGVVLNAVVIFLTFSRCAFLGFIVMIVFYLFAQRKYRSLYIFFIILLTLVLTFSYLPYPFFRFGTHGLIEHGILNIPRIERFNMALRMFKDHPLTGLGFQHFRIRFYEFYPHKDKIPYEFMIADNMYLTLLSETGIIGFLGFSMLIFSLLKKGWKQLKILDYSSSKRWQLLVSLMAFIGLLVDMGGYEFFYWPNQYIFFCIIIGCMQSSILGIGDAVHMQSNFRH
jgi:O-antigen ligase